MSSGKRTIALVSNTTWNIYNFRLNLIDKFLAEGMEVVVIAPIDEYITYKEKYPAVRHYGLRTLDRDSTNPIKDMLLVIELLRRYRQIKPDLIIHFTNKPNIYGAVAAKLVGIPSIGVVTGLGYAFINNGIIKSIISVLYRLTGKYHQKIIFENKDDRALFNELNIISKEKSIAIKGCGVDTNYYQPTTDYLPSEKVIFTFIGRLLYDKGIKEYVEAAKILKARNKNLQFWIVGELDAENPATIEKEDLVEWVEENIIYYHGFIKDVRGVIGQSDCIVLPSYREGLPRIILEGLSMAKPVITTRTAGCQETVQEGINGYLVDVKSVSQLVSAMEKFIALSTSQKLAMGAAGRQMAIHEFDDKLIANEIYQIVKGII